MIQVGHKTNDLIAVVIYLQSSKNKPFHSDWLYGENDAIAITINVILVRESIALVYRLWLNRRDTNYSYYNIAKSSFLLPEPGSTIADISVMISNNRFFTPEC